MRQIDNKFMIENNELVRMKTREVIPHNEPTILFRAKDSLALPMLIYYRNLCVNAGCTSEQLNSMDNLIKSFEKFSKEFAPKMKNPD